MKHVSDIKPVRMTTFSIKIYEIMRFDVAMHAMNNDVGVCLLNAYNPPATTDFAQTRNLRIAFLSRA